LDVERKQLKLIQYKLSEYDLDNAHLNKTIYNLKSKHKDEILLNRLLIDKKDLEINSLLNDYNKLSNDYTILKSTSDNYDNSIHISATLQLRQQLSNQATEHAVAIKKLVSENENKTLTNLELSKQNNILHDELLLLQSKLSTETNNSLLKNVVLRGNGIQEQHVETLEEEVKRLRNEIENLNNNNKNIPFGKCCELWKSKYEHIAKTAMNVAKTDESNRQLEALVVQLKSQLALAQKRVIAYEGKVKNKVEAISKEMHSFHPEQFTTRQKSNLL
jgi:hypothetical protein